MQLNQLETLLDSLKGEESIFRLYQAGRLDEVREVSNTFKSTELPQVAKLYDILFRSRYSRFKVVGVHGEKGVGKSTLASTAILDNYLAGNVDDVHYFRYNSNSQSFDQMFKLINPNPKTTKSVVGVLDDIHYFVPDFVTNVFQKGSVTQLDRFTQSLMRINGLLRGKNIMSVLLYVSDTHLFHTLRRIYDKLASGADRYDLLELLPRVSGSLSTSSHPLEIMLDNEFYGKTYAVAGGNKDFYTAARVFGSLMRDETGIFADNPRMLKYIIRQVTGLGNQMDLGLFREDKLITRILKREIIDEETAKMFFYENVGDSIREFYDELSGYCSGVLDDFRRLNVVGGYRMKNISKASKKLSISNEAVIRRLGTIRSDRNLTAKKLSNLLNRIFEYSEEKSLNYEAPLSASISSEWRRHKRYSARRYNEATKFFNDIVMLVNDFNVASADIETAIENMKKNETIKKSLRRNKQIEASKINSIRELIENIPKLTSETVDEMKQIEKNLDEFVLAIRNPEVLEKHRRAYITVRDVAQVFASSHPNLFSSSESAEVKKLLDDPDEAIRRVNPHTIDLISNLELIPY